MAPVESPWRQLATTCIGSAPSSFPQICHLRNLAKTAAILAGACRPVPQFTTHNTHRSLELNRLYRVVAHVALTHGNRSGLTILVRTPSPAAAFDGLEDKLARIARIDAKKRHRPAKGPKVRSRNALGSCGRESFEDGVHDTGEHPAPARHDGRKPRHHEITFLNFDFQRPKRPLVDRLKRARQPFVRNIGARKCAAVQSAFSFLRAPSEVDRHVLAGDDDLDVDGNDVVARTIRVQKRRRFINAITQTRHRIAALALGIVEHALDGAIKGVEAVSLDEMCIAPLGHFARRHLGPQITH